MTATVLLVHGAWRGAWCWDRVVEQLDEQHVPVIAIDLAGLQAAELADAIQFNVVEWPTSHSPFESRPDLVTELLATLARTVGP